MPAVMEAPRKIETDEDVFKRVFKAGMLKEASDYGIVHIATDDDEYVLMSRDEYTDQINDAALIAIADERMSHFDPSKLITQEEFDRRFGITEEDLEGWEDVELE